MIHFAVAALAAVMQAPQASVSASIAEDVRVLSSAPTNEARFDAITAMLRARKIPFTIEPFTIPKPIGREPRTEGRNIVVAIGEGAGDIVAGAHYDAVRLQDGTLGKGAVDNAASSVLLVRLAETLRTGKPPMRVRVVWFDMEELGLIGSAQYVQRHTADRITAMLNLDINAYGDTVLYGPSGRAENAALRRKVAENCASENIDCVSFPQMPPGDDRSFVKAGIPTVSLAILPAVEAHQLWLLVNGGANSGLAPGAAPAVVKTIHTPDDTPDKVQPDTVERMLRFTLSLLRSLAPAQ